MESADSQVTPSEVTTRGATCLVALVTLAVLVGCASDDKTSAQCVPNIEFRDQVYARIVEDPRVRRGTALGEATRRGCEDYDPTSEPIEYEVWSLRDVPPTQAIIIAGAGRGMLYVAHDLRTFERDAELRKILSGMS